MKRPALPHLAFHTRTALRLAYVVVVALATLANAELPGGPAAHTLQDAMRTTITPRDIIDGVRNVVLFAGWGAVWVGTAPLGPGIPILGGAAMTGFLLSATVEGLQLFSPRRQPSVLDLFTNTAGALLGAVVLVAAILIVRKARGARSFVGVPALVFAVPYGLTALLEAFGSLFRVDPLRNLRGGPVARFRSAFDRIDPASMWSIPWLDFVLFAPAGVFAVATLVELGVSYRSAAVAASLVGAAAVVVAELTRGFAGYPIEVGPIVGHAAAILLGSSAAALLLPRFTVRARGAQRPRALFFAYTALIAVWSWRPFYPELDLSRIAAKFSLVHLVPLSAYVERFDIATAVDVMLGFLLFVPIGALLAVWPLRLRGPLRTFLPGLYLAATVELGQLFMARRWFDTTDILIHGAAVALGWVIVRRAGFQPYGEALAARARREDAERPVDKQQFHRGVRRAR